MARELPVPLDGIAHEQYLNRLHVRMEFLHDFVSGKEDGWGVEGKELESFVEHLHRAWSVVAAAQIKRVVDREAGHRHAERPTSQGDNVIPFRR